MIIQLIFWSLFILSFVLLFYGISKSERGEERPTDKISWAGIILMATDCIGLIVYMLIKTYL